MSTLRTQGAIAFSVALLSLTSSHVDAGVLEDIFGVYPKLDKKSPPQYDSFQGARTYHFDYNTLRPTKNPGRIFYTIDDWHGSWSSKVVGDYASDLNYHNNPVGNGMTPSGGEPYDVEAVYWGIDDENVYVALITSSPHPGYVDTRFKEGSKFIVTGDIGLDLNENTKHSSHFGYDYAINITEEDRPLFGDVTSAKSEVGNKLYRTKNSDWYTGTPKGAVAGRGHLTNFDPDYGLFGKGSYVGQVTTSYHEYTFADGLQEGLTATYVIEAVIAKNLLKPQWTDDMSDTQAYTPDSETGTASIDKRVADVQPYTAESKLHPTGKTIVDSNIIDNIPEINVSYFMGCRNDLSAQ